MAIVPGTADFALGRIRLSFLAIEGMLSVRELGDGVEQHLVAD